MGRFLFDRGTSRLPDLVKLENGHKVDGSDVIYCTSP